VATPPRFYLDEDVDVRAAFRLRADGFDVLTTKDADRLSSSDESQLEFAAVDGRVMVTRNVDDFTILSRQWAQDGRTHSGLVLSGSGDPMILARKIASLVGLYPSAADWTNITVWAAD
jgi:hypothetical protein